MWQIADGGGVEQLDGSFLHQRTHTTAPYAQVRNSQSAIRATLEVMQNREPSYGWASTFPSCH